MIRSISISSLPPTQTNRIHQVLDYALSSSWHPKSENPKSYGSYLAESLNHPAHDFLRLKAHAELKADAVYFPGRHRKNLLQCGPQGFRRIELEAAGGSGLPEDFLYRGSLGETDGGAEVIGLDRG